MLQKEVADRLVAKPGTEPYGFLTLFVQLYAKTRLLMTLDPGSFHPAPKVRSAVVVLEPDRKSFASEELVELISASFRMRRKTLVNNLTGWRGLGREGALEAITDSGFSDTVRAETLPLEAFAALARAFPASS
jgi:16S rRNA (adenine1518-N6/adenine1519-N6)-dimethyltransferase